MLDPANHRFLQEANPWVLTASPSACWRRSHALRQVYLETEGDLEGED
ncbi:hypothetical protein ACPCTK_03050 [Streptomyces pseudogriseolus]